MNNQIIEKRYYAVRLRLESPLSISSGENQNTDRDVLRNGSGEVFIPGTTLAGAFKEALGLAEKENGIMGFSNGKEGKMSSMFISDIYFDSDPVVSERDGVKLTEEKTVENKFDLEIVETGATGTLYIQCLVRDNQEPEEYEKAIKVLIQKMKNGSIRFGANKTRGFGRVGFVQKKGTAYVYRKVFTKKNLEEYLAFLQDRKNLGLYETIVLDSWVANAQTGDEYVKITVPLKLNGGISIRRYSTVPGAADYEHITCNEEPVIPGSSWNGAIRADIKGILRDVGCTNASKLLREWFGYANNDNRGQNGEGLQSIIVIGESVIKGAIRMPVTRSKINRFDASTIDGALYQELSYFGGETTLEILVKKDGDRKYKALLGILDIVIDDIQKGFVAVGGLTAIGRGVFEEDGDVIFSETVDDRDKELYDTVTMGG